MLVDIGILCAGGATTTIYPSNTPDECAYILKDSGTSYVFAENEAQAKKLISTRGELPEVKRVIVIDASGISDPWLMSLADLEAEGRKYDQANPGKYEEVIKSVHKDSLATLIYTSGTTGQPKGVELTHDCWLYEGQAVDNLHLLSKADLQYFWLPLAHAFGKVLGAAQIQIGFCTAIDGRIDKLVGNLSQVKPTFVCAVPRIFEKVYNKVRAGAKEGGGLKLKIFNWAFAVGKQVSQLRQRGQEPGGLLALKNAIAQKLVFSKLQSLFGGRLRFFISGSAPLSLDMSEFFHSAGIMILEGYGLTETSAGTFINAPTQFKFGTVGHAFPGTEVKIAKEDGEILLKGRGVMRGYHNLPDATRETLDAEGYLHTGDIGLVDDQGFLRITDRKKDLIKTSGGKYVAPQMLEGKLKAACPYISQVVVHGNNRNFCSALVTLDEEAVRKWARDNNVGQTTMKELAVLKDVHALVKPAIDDLNAGLPSYETIKKFAILPIDFTQEAGELTPSLKVKRKVVEQKYKEILDGFYAGALG